MGAESSKNNQKNTVNSIKNININKSPFIQSQSKEITEKDNSLSNSQIKVDLIEKNGSLNDPKRIEEEEDVPKNDPASIDMFDLPLIIYSNLLCSVGNISISYPIASISFSNVSNLQLLCRSTFIMVCSDIPDSLLSFGLDHLSDFLHSLTISPVSVAMSLDLPYHQSSVGHHLSLELIHLVFPGRL